MKIVEGLLRHLNPVVGGLVEAHGFIHAGGIDATLRLNSGDVAGHKLDDGLCEFTATLIVDGDPPEQVGFLVTCDVSNLRNNDVVCRRPVEAAGDVCKLRGDVSGAVRVNLPAESRLQQQTIGCRWKQGKTRKLKLHAAFHFDERLALSTASTNDSARNNLPETRLEVDGLALVFFQEPLLVHDTSVVVLFN